MKVAQESAHAILICELKCVTAPVLHLLFITSCKEKKEWIKGRKEKEKEKRDREREKERVSLELTFNLELRDDNDETYTSKFIFF